VEFEDAVQAFLNEFDDKVFFDRAQVPLLIDRRFFVRDDGSIKGDNRVRRQYMRLFATALKDPDEIWVEPVVLDNGTIALKRRMFARFEIEGMPLAGVVVFEEGENGLWRAVTAFPPNAGRGENSQLNQLLRRFRLGFLVYRREDE
jgi:hypothetical protein